MQSDVSRTILFGLVQGPSPVGLCRARFPFGSCVAAPREARRAKRGGARRDRTDDLMLAKHALSQLSYGPVDRARREVVGLGRLELPTSRLSSARSNQLSYKPDEASSSGSRTYAHELRRKKEGKRGRRQG